MFLCITLESVAAIIVYTRTTYGTQTWALVNFSQS